MGHAEGYKNLYRRARTHFESLNQDFPTRDEVLDFIRPQEMYQRNFQGTPKDITVAPLLPPRRNGEAQPLSLVAIDTYMMPTVGKRRNNFVAGPYEPWRMCVVVVDCLTKYSISYPVQQNAKGRAQSAQTRDALILFRQRMRNLTNDQTLHILRTLQDRGSEFKGEYQTWMDNERNAAGYGYEVVEKTGTKAHANSLAERNVAIHRRYMMARYQAEKEKDEAAGGDPRTFQTRYDYIGNLPMPGSVIDEVNDRVNSRHNKTINARPIDAANVNMEPSYEDCQRRIVAKARKRYGGRVVDGAIPGFSGAGPMQVGDLVRVKIFTSGAPTTNVAFEKSNKKSHLNWGDLHRIIRVSPARGFKATTYQIEDMSGEERRGWWDRSQLLRVDPRTQIDAVSDDEDADEDVDDEDPDEEQLDPPPPPPVYARPRVANNTHRYSVNDVVQFAREWRHAGLGPARPLQAKITNAYTRRVGGQEYLVYDCLFTLANGRQRTITYTAKPLARGAPGRDPDAAVDTSQFVSYVHS
jgi:Txe/YoeB family toxin of Txe-Axe toxin-antitoxin module